jgi:hypothetical protein
VRLPKWFEKSRAPLYILLIFLCGVVSGALATNLWTGKIRQAQAAVQTDLRGPFNRTQRLVDRFTRDLNLSPEQTKQLADILDEMRLRYQIKEDSTRAEGRDRIRRILTPEQLAKYEGIVAGADERRRIRRMQDQ